MTTGMKPSSYLARETFASAVINAVISVGFFLLVFGGVHPVPVWGIGNYAFDFLPQSFAIGLMATLVPGLMCRKALAHGRIAGRAGAPVEARSVAASAVVNAILAVVFGVGLCALVFWAVELDALSHSTAFVLKILYGTALGSLTTYIVLRRMMS